MPAASKWEGMDQMAHEVKYKSRQRSVTRNPDISGKWTGGSRIIQKVVTAASKQVVRLKPCLEGLTHVLLLQLSVALVLLHQLRTARALRLQFHGHLAQ